MSHRRYPSYVDDADYTTNAPSYYEELARKQGLIKELAERIWGYEETLNLSMQEIAQRFIDWDSKIAGFDGDVNVLLQEWIADGTFDHIINDTIFGWKANQTEIVRLEDKMILHISDFPRLVLEVSDDGRFSRALASMPKGVIALKGIEYLIKEHIELSNYQTLQGTFGATSIKKIDGGTSKFLIKYKTTTGYIYGSNVRDIRLEYYGSQTDIIAINLDRSSQIALANLYITGNFYKGVIGAVVWLASYDNITVWCDSTFGHTGFDIIDGTSNSLNRVWVKNYARGYNMGITLYSAMTACACDTFTQYAYNGGQGIVYNGCGAEGATLVNGGFVFGNTNRSATLNGCQTYNIGIDPTTTAGNCSTFYSNGSRMTVNNFRMQTDFNTPNIANLVNVDSDGIITINNSQLATNYNAVAKLTNAFGEVVINTGSKQEIFRMTTDDNVLTTLANEYTKGFRKQGGASVMGKPFNPTTTFKAVTQTHKNTYQITTNGTIVKLPILTSTTATAGTYAVIVDIVAVSTNYDNASGAVAPSKVSILAKDANGTKTIHATTVVNGAAAHNVTPIWEGNQLSVSLEKSYGKTFLEVTVFQVESSGSALLEWK